MKLYRCVYQMGVETALEYRANMVLTLLSTIFPIIIQTFFVELSVRQRGCGSDDGL